MDSKELRRRSQANMDVEKQPEEANDRSPEQSKSARKLAKIQNGMVVGERLKLNNNICEGEAKCIVASKASLVMSKGCQPSRPERLEQRSEETAEASRMRSIEGLSDRSTECSNGSTLVNQNPLTPESPIGASHVTNGCSNSSQSCASAHLDSKSPNVSGLEGEKISRVDSDIRNNVDYTLGIEKCPAKVSCAGDGNAGVMWPAGGYPSNETSMNNIGARIGSTSHGTCCYLRPNINGGTRCEEVENGPSVAERRDECERRDSSSGNEGDSSDVEDYCIYTYKGNDEASGALHLRQPTNPRNDDDEDAAAAGQPNSGRSSPEMDFLEMDFDPGPSCEQDTGDSDLASINEDIQNLTLDNVDSEPCLLNDLSGGKLVSRQQRVLTPEVTQTKQLAEHNVGNAAATHNAEATSSNRPTCSSSTSQCMPSTSAGLRKWEATSLNRSNGCPLRESYSYHNTSGDLISPGENRDADAELWAENSSVSIPENANFNTRKNNLSSTLYHRMMAKKLMLNKQTTFSQSGDSNLESELCSVRLDGSPPVEKIMLWSEQEATVKQVTQIGTSACGATSAINALLALDVPFSLEVLVKGIATRLREPGTPLPRYLVSRSRAGAAHKDLIRGISLATNGAVITKFFPFYPERNVSLSHWLHYWISRGAAPIATLNLQNCGTGSNIPDAWHHQMIFGVSQSGIYMTNPLECLPEQLVWHQLVSPSILLIKRADVLAHWNPSIDLTPLMRWDQHWRKLNVLGQVVNMIRETMSERKQPTNSSIGPSHIRIPACYQAGITLVMRTDAAAAEELLHTEQLPLL